MLNGVDEVQQPGHGPCRLRVCGEAFLPDCRAQPVRGLKPLDGVDFANRFRRAYSPAARRKSPTRRHLAMAR